MILLPIFIVISGCSFSLSNGHETDSPKKVNMHSSSSIHPKERANVDLYSEISVSAIGDILIHERVYRPAKTTEGYNFLPMLNQVKPFLNSSTITIANQETMIGGKSLGLSGYPQFNSPTAIGDNLKELGVDVVTLANNHTLDRGEKGVKQAIQHWEKISMAYTGAYKTKKDSQNLLVYPTEENIKVAILSYTYGTNGIAAPPGKSYIVNKINYKQIAEDIKKANKQADAIILSLHFGDQYKPYPNSFQKKLVQFAADRGVDVVLGHHPHVLQPLEWIHGKQGNRMLAIYSLGNFFSGQDSLQTRIGGILTFNLKKFPDKKDKIRAINPRFKLTYVTSDGPVPYKVVPMDELSELKEEYKRKKKHLSQWMPNLQFIE